MTIFSAEDLNALNILEQFINGLEANAVDAGNVRTTIQQIKDNKFLSQCVVYLQSKVSHQTLYSKDKQN